MTIADYEYPLDQCDVPAVRRKTLAEYRQFRRKCLEYLRGDADSSVMNQIHGLAWHTAVFRTLNEARRVEPDRPINGAMWELIGAGYSNLMTLGVRRLVDRNPRTDSLWNVVVQLEKRPELLRRENFVCYDGLPYDADAAMQTYIDSRDFSSGAPRFTYLTTKGPTAWATSQLLHKAFDALSGYPRKRKRLDIVQPAIISSLKAALDHESIKAVCTLADKVIAHAERIAEGSVAVPTVTYNMIDEALQHLVRAASFLSAHFFYDVAFGSIVPVPQFNVLEHLDQPWARTETLRALHEHWDQVSQTLTSWGDEASRAFAPSDPSNRENE